MLGEIIEIKENIVIVKCQNINTYNNIMNNYVLLRDTKNIIGEIISIQGENIYINLLGEIKDNSFIFGITTKPSFKSNVQLVSENNIPFILSYQSDERKSLYLGKSAIYENISIHINLNRFFNSHFAILGGTGSGKSFGFARIVQNIFNTKNYIPYKASLFIFDTYGEYHNAFLKVEDNPHIAFKSYTTRLDSNEEILKIPPFLLGVDDLAILLNATTPNQLQVLEKALRLVKIFSRSDEEIIKIKNDIIARSVLDILLSGRPSVQIRDQIFSILAFYKTKDLNLDTILYQPGYNRALKHCLIVDADGKIREMELLTDFFSKYLLEEKEEITETNVFYTLNDLENAIDFALISEGILKSEKIYDDNNLLKVRIHSLINSEAKIYFEYENYISLENYINTLLTKNTQKAQIINFNINYIDDRLAKIIVKILAKMLFDVLKNLKPRASLPFHIILEEAHRYVQNDNDINLLGYNIFERIAKEGRKYGILLGLISQRPSELSETTLSQVNNFLIFKTAHPKDIEYIYKLIPFLTEEIKKRLQIIQPGYCYCFGPAFKVPTIVKLEKPNPTPESNNVNISNTWFIANN